MLSIKLVYRLAITADIDAIYDMYMDPVSNPFLTYDAMELESFEILYQQLLLTNTVFVVELDNEIVASYRLIPKTDRQAHIIYLGSFVVKNTVKGKGVGSRTIELIKANLKNKDIKRIELTVSPDNIAAVALYKKCGFVIEGLLKANYKLSQTGEYYDEYLMACYL